MSRISRRTLNRAFVATIASIALLVGVTPAEAAVIRPATAMTQGSVSYTNDCDSYFYDGCTLTAAPMGWSAGGNPLEYTYQWKRNGVAISGATEENYVMNQSDVHKNITVTITVSASGYTTATASSTPVKTASNKVCTVVGTIGDDMLVGTTKADIICGVAGNDIIKPFAGNDTVDGGGDATIDYSSDTSALTVSLVTGKAKSAKSGTDTISGVKNVISGSGNDTVTGNSGPNLIRAGAGKDTVHGGEGSDVIVGGAGDDKLYGEAGDDHLSGLAGTDTLVDPAGSSTWCDKPDRWADGLPTDCQIYIDKPVLLNSSFSRDSVYASVSDPMGTITNVSMFITEDPEPSMGMTPLSTGEVTNFGTSANAWYSTDFAPGSVWGRRYLIILVTTEDSRSRMFVGNGNDLFTALDDPTVEVGSGWSAGPDYNRAYFDYTWDVTPPTIEGVSASSTSVDTASGSQDITFTAALANGETANSIWCSLTPLDAALFNFYASSVESGSNACTLTLDQGIPSGRYGLTIQVTDEAGNRAQIKADPFAGYFRDASGVLTALGTDFLGLVINQTGAGATEAASMGAVTFSATTVSTKTKAAVITATFPIDFADGELGEMSFCALSNPRANYDGFYAEIEENPSGSYEALLWLPKGAPKGRYALACEIYSTNGWTSKFTGDTAGTWDFEGPLSSAVTTSVTSYITVN